MSESQDQTSRLNIRLKPNESSAHPHLFIAIAKIAEDGQAAPKGLKGASSLA